MYVYPDTQAVASHPTLFPTRERSSKGTQDSGGEEEALRVLCMRTLTSVGVRPCGIKLLTQVCDRHAAHAAEASVDGRGLEGKHIRAWGGEGGGEDRTCSFRSIPADTARLRRTPNMALKQLEPEKHAADEKAKRR